MKISKLINTIKMTPVKLNLRYRVSPYRGGQTKKIYNKPGQMANQRIAERYVYTFMMPTMVPLYSGKFCTPETVLAVLKNGIE